MFVDIETGRVLDISSQYFSGTDKDANGNEPGVVFPLACDDSVKNTLNVSSILDHRNDYALCKYTEARVANADTEKKVVEYCETKVLSLEYDLDKSVFDELLQSNSKFIYQCKNKITDKLKDKLAEYLKALHKNETKFDASVIIDKELISEKKYSYGTYGGFKNIRTPSLFNDNINEIKDEEFDKTIDLFTEAFEKYIAELYKEDRAKFDKVIDYGLNHYYNTCDHKKMLSTNLWGKEINDMKKEYKDLFDDAIFQSELASEIVDIITAYDVGLNDDKPE